MVQVIIPAAPSAAADGGDPNRFSEEGNSSMSMAKRLCLNSTTNYIDSLSDDLLFDILLLLPADFLYEKARFVCRKWYNIIRSDGFTNAQILRSSTGLFLSSRTCPNRPIFVTSVRGRIQTQELSYTCGAKIVGSSNGFIVVYDEEDEALPLHVINPTTKQKFRLPPIPIVRDKRLYSYDYSRCSISYSAASAVYKITLPYGCGLLILTVGVDKSWRNVPIQHTPYDDVVNVVKYHRPLTTEGFLHWSTGFFEVLSMNVETESFTFSTTPEPYSHRSYYTLSTGRYLSALCGKSFDGLVWEVWELRPESGGWRNLMYLKIDLRPLECRLRPLAASRLHANRYPPPPLAAASRLHGNLYPPIAASRLPANLYPPPAASRLHGNLYPLGWVIYPEVLAFSFQETNLDTKRACIFYNLDTCEIVDTIELPKSDRTYRALVHRNNLVWFS